MYQNSGSWWQNLPPVTRKILAANVIVWLISSVLERVGMDLSGIMGLWSWSFSAFGPLNYSFHIWQPLTYMFMHAGFWHLFCNMFAVLMFGAAIEQRWGSKRYLIYYIVSGLGAALVQELIWMYFGHGMPAVTVGASGAVFGILLAFGWLFPDVKMFLLFVPIPIPARIFVALYALFELSAGIANTAGDNIAHFAHLGGMLFGWLLILYWQKRGYSGFAMHQYHSPLWDKIKLWWREHMQGIRTEKKDDPHAGYHYQAPVGSAPEGERTSARRRSEEVDKLLDKVKMYGYDSLTKEEKAKLFG